MNAHEGIPLSLSPLVMNQKISPSVTPFSFPSISEGTFPVPFNVFPWHARQFLAYTVLPASIAACCPVSGFFVVFADAGASWNGLSAAFNIKNGRAETMTATLNRVTLRRIGILAVG